MKRTLLLLAASLLPLAYLPLQSGCSNQSEGQLCSPLNGDLDCNTGLTCRTLPGETGEHGVCCGTGSTHPACIGNATTTIGTTSSSSTTTSSSSSGMGGAGGTGGTGGHGGTGGTGGTGGASTGDAGP